MIKYNLEIKSGDNSTIIFSSNSKKEIDKVTTGFYNEEDLKNNLIEILKESNFKKYQNIIKKLSNGLYYIVLTHNYKGKKEDKVLYRTKSNLNFLKNHTEIIEKVLDSKIFDELFEKGKILRFNIKKENWNKQSKQTFDSNKIKAKEILKRKDSYTTQRRLFNRINNEFEIVEERNLDKYKNMLIEKMQLEFKKRKIVVKDVVNNNLEDEFEIKKIKIYNDIIKNLNSFLITLKKTKNNFISSYIEEYLENNFKLISCNDNLLENTASELEILILNNTVSKESIKKTLDKNYIYLLLNIPDFKMDLYNNIKNESIDNYYGEIDMLSNDNKKR